jgi:hypothetical protein
MKRLITGALALLFSLVASATTLNPIQLLNPAGSSSGQAIVSTGASSAPAWGGVGLNGIAAIAGNTLIGNATSSSAVPTAVSVSNCAGTSSALNYTSGSGFSCNGSINALTVSGNAVGTSGGTIPLLNGVNTWSGAQTFSALITPSSTIGIKGTAGNDNANAGSIGEFVSSNVAAGSAVALTTTVSANVTSISLTAGDWEVWGFVGIVTGGSTVVSTEQGGLSAVSATLPTLGTGGAQFFHPITLPTGQGMYESVGTVRVSLASTTTIYLVANFAFSTSTCSAYGFIGARRRR